MADANDLHTTCTCDIITTAGPRESLQFYYLYLYIIALNHAPTLGSIIHSRKYFFGSWIFLLKCQGIKKDHLQKMRGKVGLFNVIVKKNTYNMILKYYVSLIVFISINLIAIMLFLDENSNFSSIP